jgi:hypothetical protein
MIKFCLILIIGSLFFYSCSKEKTDVPKGIAVLISKNADCTCDPYINQYLWRDKSVYALAFKGASCNWQPAYFDESGTEFSMVTGYSFDSFLQEAHFIKNIWICDHE